MAFEVGKRVVAESESTDRRPRSGVVEEVLRGDPAARYWIRWDDGTRESTRLRAAPFELGWAAGGRSNRHDARARRPEGSRPTRRQDRRLTGTRSTPGVWS